MKNAVSTPELLLKILSDACIESVAIIDDAFDPISGAELGIGIDEFWDHCLRESDSQLTRELKSFCERYSEVSGQETVITDREDFTDDLLTGLRNSLHLFPSLRKTSMETLFALHQDKLAPILDLQSRLHELKLTVRQFGTEFEFGDFRPKIIFLDYFLGVTDDSTAVETARIRIKEIYDLYEIEAEKPFVVLMSSRDVGSNQREFCDDAKILYGLLTFAPKNELRTKEHLYYHLASWSLDLPSRHVVQLFVEALESSLKEAQSQFSAHLRKLGIEDYANLQWLSLQDDGHPLGDYMLWLLKEMLAHLLHNNERVLKSQQSLDALQVGRFLPSSSPPSLDLAKLYRMALTEPGFKPADRHPASRDDGTDFHLKLGDMFFNDEKREVLMALSASCDLAYSATSNLRSFPSNRLVLFAQGEMELTDTPPKAASIKTEPFLHEDGKIYRICWKHRNAVWKEYGQAKEWFARNGFVHKAQMSLPYALEIQKSYANNISRIGLPVHPPTSTWPTIDICCEGGDGKWYALLSVERGAQIVKRRKGDGETEILFVMCRDSVFHLPAAMSKADAVFENQEAELRSFITQLTVANDKHKEKKIERAQQKLSRLSEKRAKIAAIDCSPQACLPLVLNPRVLDELATHVVLGADLPWLYIDADYTSDFKAGTPLAINIRRIDG